MGQRKKKKGSKTKRKAKKQTGLQGITKSVNTGRVTTTLKEGGLMLLAAIAAGGAGAAIGKHSLALGIPVTLAGAYKKNPYIIAAGLGLAMSNGFQNATKTSTTTNGVNGFDIKEIAQGAKDRMSTFFDNFKEKLYLPATTAPSATDGLGENDNVRYFINPYGTKELDLSAMDRINAQVNAGAGTSGFDDDTDREF